MARIDRRTLLARLALGMGGLAGLVACAPPEEPRPQNLILVSIDTLRADHLGCYGYERPTTPTLDAIAEEGVLFEDASATSPWTKPSHASLFTGLYPRKTGAIGFMQPMALGIRHLAEHFRGAGFRTAAVVSNSLLTTHGLEAGFQQLEFTERAEGPEPSLVNDLVVDWLDGRGPEEPFFLFVHYIDPHPEYRSLPRYEDEFVRPYEGMANGRVQQLFAHVTGAIRYTEEDGRHLVDLYDAAIRQTDDQVLGLVEELKARGLWDESLFALVSDHGEEFLEHGGVQHGLTQYEESVRIPFLLRGPGIPAGRRVSEMVSLVDVLPTLLALFDLRVPAGLDGVDLRPLWTEDGGRLARRSLFFEANNAVPTAETVVLEPGSRRAVRGSRYKLHRDLETGELELYDLAEDPGERVDLAGELPEVVDRLEKRLERFLRTSPMSVEAREFSEEELRRLEALGYVGPGDE